MTNIQYVTGDATAPIGEGKKIIAHVCNDKGGWGAGFVLALSAKWKEPEREYRNLFRTKGLVLGDTQIVPISDSDILVCNMVCQHGYKSQLNPVPLDYAALRVCLHKLQKLSVSIGASVHMPRIGCGLAGGQWGEISTLIEEELCFEDIPVFVYDLG